MHWWAPRVPGTPRPLGSQRPRTVQAQVRHTSGSDLLYMCEHGRAAKLSRWDQARARSPPSMPSVLSDSALERLAVSTRASLFASVTLCGAW